MERPELGDALVTIVGSVDEFKLGRLDRVSLVGLLLGLSLGVLDVEAIGYKLGAPLDGFEGNDE